MLPPHLKGQLGPNTTTSSQQPTPAMNAEHQEQSLHSLASTFLETQKESKVVGFGLGDLLGCGGKKPMGIRKRKVSFIPNATSQMVFWLKFVVFFVEVTCRMGSFMFNLLH